MPVSEVKELFVNNMILNVASIGVQCTEHLTIFIITIKEWVKTAK
jgi:hypothetical protein